MNSIPIPSPSLFVSQPPSSRTHRKEYPKEYLRGYPKEYQSGYRNFWLRTLFAPLEFSLTFSLASFLVAILLSSSLASPAFGQRAGRAASGSLSYDWRAALKGALDANENIHAQEQKLLHARKSRNASISLAAVPRINVSGEGGAAFASVSSLSDASSNGLKPYVDVSLEIKQSLADGGERKAGLRDHRLQVQIARTSLRKAEQDLIVQALQNYVDLRYRALLFRTQQRRAFILTQSTQLVAQSEENTLWDTWRLRQVAQEGESLLLESRKELDASRGAFVSTFRFVPDVTSLIRVDLPLDLIPRTFEESLQVARRSNPSYHMETQRAQRATNVLLRERSKGIPKLSMVAEGRYRYNPVPETFHDGSNDELLAYAGLRVDWSLADTFRLKSLVGAARAEAGVAEGIRGTFAQSHGRVIADAWNELVSLSAQYNAQRTFGVENAQMLQALRNSSEEEATSPARISELEAQFLQTQVQFLDVERRLTIAYIALLGEMGLLDRATLNI